jgi:hypothetical protein
MNNARRRDLEFETPLHRTAYIERRRISYDGSPGSILNRMLRSAHIDPLRPLTFDLPETRGLHVPQVPYVVVRPATVRREWVATSRNPKPDYITAAARAAQLAGYAVICVAHLQDGEEDVVGLLPPAHSYYLKGELPLEMLMALVQHAAGVIGGVGWLLPMALACRVPMLCIWGGWGEMNGPDRVLDARMGLDRLVCAMPDPLCMCNDKNHNCEKTIPNFRRYIDGFLELAASTHSRMAG